MRHPITDCEAYDLIHEIEYKGEYPAHEWLVLLAKWAWEKSARLEELEEKAGAK